MTRMKSRLLPAAAAILFLVAIGTVLAQAQQIVDQKNKQFSQTTVTVKAGEAVTFTNSDDVTHDLSIKDPDDTKILGQMEHPGDHVTVTFDKIGEYQVMCLIHPKMKMTVIVK